MALGHIIKDLFVYNSTIVLLFFSLNSNSYEGSQNTFIERLVTLSHNSPLENLLISNHGLIYQSILTGLFLLSIFSILSNKKILEFLHTVLLGFFSFVIFNPFLPENKIEASFGIRRELIFSVGIFIVRMMNILDFKRK